MANPEFENQTEKVTEDIPLNMEEFKSELENLDKDFILLGHQTYRNSAEKIMANKESFHDVHGSTNILSPETILKIVPELDKPVVSERTVLTHKGANTMVVMVFPKKLYMDARMSGQGGGTALIEGMLIDLYMEEKIPEVANLPNNFIFGYYTGGVFYKNNNFEPQFK